MGDESDVSYLLETHKPRIVVDQDGGEPLLSFVNRWTVPHSFQWVGSFVEKKHSHPKLPLWVHH